MNDKIIWITDDIEKDEYEMYEESFKEQNINLKIKNNFKFEICKIVFIDYGMMGDFDNSLMVLRDYFLKKIPIYWLGGLGNTGYYERAVLIDFPQNKFLHNINSIELHNKEYSIKRLLNNLEKIENG